MSVALVALCWAGTETNHGDHSDPTVESVEVGVIGPRIGGVLFDKYKNYQIAFYTAGVLAAVALLAELLARRPKAV